MIENNQKVSINAISETLGINRSSINRTIDKMKKNGKVERVGGTRGH